MTYQYLCLHTCLSFSKDFLLFIKKKNLSSIFLISFDVLDDFFIYYYIIQKTECIIMVALVYVNSLSQLHTCYKAVSDNTKTNIEFHKALIRKQHNQNNNWREIKSTCIRFSERNKTEKIISLLYWSWFSL